MKHTDDDDVNVNEKVSAKNIPSAQVTLFTRSSHKLVQQQSNNKSSKKHITTLINWKKQRKSCAIAKLVVNYTIWINKYWETVLGIQGTYLRRY